MDSGFQQTFRNENHQFLVQEAMLGVTLALYRLGGELYFPDYISCGSSFYILFVGYGDAFS